MEFLFGMFLGFILGMGTIILWMVFTFDPERKWNEPWESSQTED